MKINHIRMQRFGCFDDREIYFEPGLNIIKGPNEAGKSTLHQALMMGLLERPSQKKATQPYKKWGADQWYCLTVEFETEEGGLWLLIKDFENKSQELSESNGNSTKNLDQIQSLVGQNLGTTSLNIFKSTVCVAQDALTEISAGRKEISQSLEQIITGGDEDVYTTSAIKALEGKVGEYRRGYLTRATVNLGPIARFQAEHEKLRIAVRNYRESVSDWEHNEDKQRQSQERLQKIEKELAPRQELLTQAERAKEVQREKDKWVEREQELDRRLDEIRKAEQTAADAQQQLKLLSPVSDVTENEVQATALIQERVGVLKNEKEKATKRWEQYLAETAKRPEPAARSSLLPPGLLTFVGAVGFLVGILLLILIDNPAVGGILAGLGLFTGGVGVVWMFFIYLQAQNKTAEPLTPMPQEFDDSELTAAETERNEKLTTLNCDNLEELEVKWKQVQASRKQYESAGIHLKALIPEGKTKTEFVDGRKYASRKRRDAEELLEEPALQRAMALDAIAIQKLQSDTSKLIDEKADLAVSVIRLSGKLEEPTITREELLSAEERLSYIEFELERTKQRLAIYEMALETMRSARARTLKRAQDELAPRMGAYLEKLTLGRFNEVQVDSNLNIRVRHPDNAATMVTPERLSTGTQDQLYMAARLALIDLLFQDAKPPIFLDDPFVKFDPQRRAAATALCRQISEDRQMLLFSCSSEYDSAGHVIELQGRK
jgi:DNA repair exonuclease SbcCD ATPase subunit